MIFTFETLPLENKEILQKHLLERFERDIASASCEYDMYSYKFIFSEGCFPAVIRVDQETPHNTMEDMLCELMWIDDLKTDIPNICQPLPSLRNRLVERIVVGETTYLAAMFRKANGAITTGGQWDSSFFYNAGVLLGKIHRTSSEGYQRGFRYKRKHLEDLPFLDFSCFEGHFEPHVQQVAQALAETIKSIPRDPRWYGMILGQFYHGNLLCDWGDLWMFSSNACCHGPFIVDIVGMANVCIQSQSYAAKYPDTSAHDRMWGEDGILTHMRAGYSTEYQLPDEQWAMIDDCYRLDAAAGLAFITIYDVFPKDIMSVYAESVLAYFEDDKSPIDRVDEVQQNLISRLTPEQRLIVEAELPWMY